MLAFHLIVLCVIYLIRLLYSMLFILSNLLWSYLMVMFEVSCSSLCFILFVFFLALVIGIVSLVNLNLVHVICMDTHSCRHIMAC